MNFVTSFQKFKQNIHSLINFQFLILFLIVTSLSRKTVSLFLLPNIEFQRQSSIATVYNAYLAEVVMAGSFKLLTIRSIPPFCLNNLLFLLQSLQRFEMMEKHSSFISIGFSFSCCNKSIKLSRTPSSVIFNL